MLEGQLTDPFISELERSWAEAQLRTEAQAIAIDLKDVTAISQRGEDVLFQMMADGVQINCCRGILTKHVLQQLERRRAAQSGKVIHR